MLGWFLDLVKEPKQNQENQEKFLQFSSYQNESQLQLLKHMQCPIETIISHFLFGVIVFLLSLLLNRKK